MESFILYEKHVHTKKFSTIDDFSQKIFSCITACWFTKLAFYTAWLAIIFYLKANSHLPLVASTLENTGNTRESLTLARARMHAHVAEREESVGREKYR